MVSARPYSCRSIYFGSENDPSQPRARCPLQARFVPHGVVRPPPIAAVAVAHCRPTFSVVSIATHRTGGGRGAPGATGEGSGGRGDSAFRFQDSVSGWRNVFFLSAAVNVFGLAFYLTFGQAEIQDWAKERTLTRL